jgi:hypothetical protein
MASYSIDQLRILSSQRKLKQRIKKGDTINVGQEDINQIQQILNTESIAFTTLKSPLEIYLVTIS